MFHQNQTTMCQALNTKNTISLYICIKSMHFPHAPLPKGQKYLQVFQVNKKNHGDIK